MSIGAPLHTYIELEETQNKYSVVSLFFSRDDKKARVISLANAAIEGLKTDDVVIHINKRLPNGSYKRFTI